jgi:hypothetical protein
VRSGGNWDRWDLQVRGGLLGAARLRLAIEEHGGGSQLVRIRSWPRFGPGGLVLIVLVAIVAAFASVGDAEAATVMLASLATVLLGRALYECGLACAAIRGALPQAVSDIEPARSAVEQGARVNLAELAEQMRLASCSDAAVVNEVEHRSRALGAGR